jgi:hypothetical protein
MDVEIRKAIDAVRADLRGLEARLRADLHAEMSALEGKLRLEIREEGANIRRHADLRASDAGPDATLGVLSLRAPIEK